MPTPKSPCRWKRCRKPATKLLLGVALCDAHRAEGLKLEGQKAWPAYLRAVAKRVTAESARDLRAQADVFDRELAGPPEGEQEEHDDDGHVEDEDELEDDPADLVGATTTEDED